MRSLYIPYAVRQPALLACMLYVAARRYCIFKGDGYAERRFHKGMLQYKQVCLRALQRGVATIPLASLSEVTVFLAIVMSSEAVISPH